MRAYSQDLRERVLNALERGQGPTEIARRYEVSRTWVYEVRQRWRQDGLRCSLPVGGYKRSRIADKEQQIRQWIEAAPDLTLAEICQRLSEQGINISTSALWYQLDKWALSFKKNAARQRAGSGGCASGTRPMEK